MLEEIYYPSLAIAYARALRRVDQALVVIVDAPDVERMERLAADHGLEAAIRVRSAPTADGLVINIADVYYPRLLRRIARTGVAGDPAWRIRTRGDIPRAATTLERDAAYFMARYLVIPVARRIAQSLRHTRVSPDAVTVLSCACGLMAAVLMVGDAMIFRGVAAVLIHASITLDFSDGFLARLRGEESRFGYWLDTLLDEVVKIALYIGLTVLGFRSAGTWWPLAVGALLIAAYHTLAVNLWLQAAVSPVDVTQSLEVRPREGRGLRGRIGTVVNRLTQLDVVLYVIALTLVLRIELITLPLYAAIYGLSLIKLIVTRLAAHPVGERA